MTGGDAACLPESARGAGPLPDWLDNLTASGLAPLAGVDAALREDQEAVTQGVIAVYNSRVNECHITDMNSNYENLTVATTEST
ncbi:hypothetical protein ABT300_36650 [Streptomyces sp. NPDC001027]|uniref:hypothetical protein n=1 Tax=Streptomyces sp. NPDC001027 TaxID=3154771 RepID=UPI00331BC04A